MSPQEISYWFSTEVKPHEGALRGYLYNRMDKPADVDDIVQETFKRIVEVQRKQPVHSTRGLLFTIAKNLQMDHYRSNKISQTFFVAEMDSLDVIDNRDEPHELLCKSDELEFLKAAIRTLPKKCRTILLLRKFENWSHREIAAHMNISVNTVETQLTRGLKKCQKYFERYGFVQHQKR